MSDTLSCLVCDKQLTSESASAEHVIPNALGGRLTTKSATCVKCNSSSGHGTDIYLVRKFKLLANALDVIRDRGKHPEATFADPNTGRKYRMEPGKNPLLDSNISVQRSGSGITSNFNAPTRGAAERLLKQFAPKKPHTIKSLEGIKRPAENFTFNSSYSVYDDTLMRNIARIAVNFVRHAGIPIDSSDPTVRFSRGEDIGWCPVGPPHSDVISILGLPEHPLYHGIFLSKPSSHEPLIVYVVLFQFCEFLVSFGANCTTNHAEASYQQNLVTGLTEDRTFQWLINTNKACQWISSREINPARLKDRFAPLQHYLSNRDKLWVDRALGIAMKCYFDSIDHGATREQASADALEKANQVLKRYEMRIQTLEIK